MEAKKGNFVGFRNPHSAKLTFTVDFTSLGTCGVAGGRSGTPRGVHACAYPGPAASRLLRVACHVHACAYMLLACLCWSMLNLYQERKKVFSECGLT